MPSLASKVVPSVIKGCHKSFRKYTGTWMLGIHKKDKIYHIPHVNATHKRVKKWIDERFWGVSTKHLQQYLNWYRINESIKNHKNKIQELAKKSIVDTNAYGKYRKITENYQILISTQI